MSLRYLPEYAQIVIFSLELARKEAEHLRYSESTLFNLTIDLEWVKSLNTKPELAEKVGVLDSVDAFIVARKLINTLVHEYMYDALVFLESLLSAQQACYLFFSVIEKTELEINHLGVQK